MRFAETMLCGSGTASASPRATREANKAFAVSSGQWNRGTRSRVRALSQERMDVPTAKSVAMRTSTVHSRARNVECGMWNAGLASFSILHSPFSISLNPIRDQRHQCEQDGEHEGRVRDRKESGHSERESEEEERHADDLESHLHLPP